jgi:hypothetical protein
MALFGEKYIAAAGPGLSYLKIMVVAFRTFTVYFWPHPGRFQISANLRGVATPT